MATATGFAAIGAVTLAPSGSTGPVGLAGAVAALQEPDVLLHFKVTTRHSPSGAIETGETWQTPDGRRMRTLYGSGTEFAYDQHARVVESYAPESDEVIVDTDPTLFTDEDQPFGSVATGVTSSPTRIGDLPALVTRALSGDDPNVRHVGRTTVRGIDVDHIRITQELEMGRAATRTATPPTR